MTDTPAYSALRRIVRRHSKNPLQALMDQDVADMKAALALEIAAALGSPPVSTGAAGGARSGPQPGVAPQGGPFSGAGGEIQGIPDLQQRLGVAADGNFGPMSRAALFAKLSNLNAPALTEAEFAAVALDLGVPVKLIKAVREVEAPRGPFDDDGRPSILYERHVFRRNASDPDKFERTHPTLCGPPYGSGGYGPFSAQYEKLGRACALDPEAAFRACSWGAFQVLGENATALGYPSAFDMALVLTASEAAHLDSFARFVKTNSLADELRACKPSDPESCIPFVRAYNGKGFKEFRYHVKLAEAMR